MDPVVESVSVNAVGAATSIAVTKPSGLAVGNLMLGYVARRAGTGTIGYPGDWTPLTFNNGSDVQIQLGWRIATSGDVSATDFTFTGSALANLIGAILRISNFNPLAPINAQGHVGSAQTATLSATHATSITPSVPGCLIVMFMAANDDTGAVSAYAITTDNPATWTEAFDQPADFGADSRGAAAYAIRPQTTPTGGLSFSQSTSEVWNASIVAIAPLVGGSKMPANRPTRFFTRRG